VPYLDHAFIAGKSSVTQHVINNTPSSEESRKFFVSQPLNIQSWSVYDKRANSMEKDSAIAHSTLATVQFYSWSLEVDKIEVVLFRAASGFCQFQPLSLNNKQKVNLSLPLSFFQDQKVPDVP